MADRSIVVKLRADVAGFKANIASAKKSVDDLTKADTKKPGKSFEDFSNKAAIAGAVVAVGVGKAVKSFADFDAQMSAASAALPEAGAQMDNLRQLSIQLGKDTQFSATEAAAGVTEMAKAGVSAGDILNGGLKGGLDLAAAGQLDVARASEIAATALNQFGLKGTDVSHVADLYAAAAGKAQGSVEDIAMAMKYAGVTAAAMGISIEETTGVMGLFASKGIIGEQAGTSFRSMLLSLTSPSVQAAGVMEELGINVYDASGKFIGMQGVAGQLQEKMSGLDEATRNQALGQIFGNESMNAAVALYQGGASAVADWTKKVNDAGFAQKQAAKLTDNLKGDIERLSGSIETVFIQAGSGANDALRNITQGAGNLVDYLGKIPGPLLLAGTAFGALALVGPKVVLSFRQWKSNLDQIGLSMDKLSAKAPRTAKGLSMVGKAAGTLGVAATAVYAFAGAADRLNADKLGAELGDTADGLGLINAQLAASTNNGWGRVGSDIDSFGKIIGATFDPGIINNIDNTVGSLKTVFGGENVSNIANASKQLAGIDQAMASLVTSGHVTEAQTTFAQLTAVAASQGVTIDQLLEKMPAYAAAIAKAGGASSQAGDDIGGMSENVKQVEQNAEDAKKALDDLTATIEGFGSPLAAQRAAQRDFADSVDAAKEALKKQRDELIKQREDELVSGRASQSSLDALAKAKQRVALAQEKLNAVEKKGTDAQKLAARQSLDKANLSLSQAQSKVGSSTGSLTEADRRAAEAYADAKLKQTNLLDINTEAGRANQAALDGIRDATLKAAAKTFELTHSQELAAAEVTKGRQSFIDQATAFGMSAAKANELADNMGLIPNQTASAIKLSGVETANSQLDTITGKVTILDKTTAKPQVKPFVNTGAADAVEARIDQIARQREAFINLKLRDFTTGMGLSGANRAVNDKPFADGGYTGAGGKWQPAGIVHKGEVVWSQADIRRWGGVHVVESLRTTGGYADGGVVGTAVAASSVGLGGRDLAMLLAALNQPRHNYNINGTGNPEAVAQRVMDAQEWKWVNGG